MQFKASVGVLLLFSISSVIAEDVQCTDVAPTFEQVTVTASIPGTSRVVGLLECANSASTDARTIVAVFDGDKSTVCFSRTALMDQSGNFFLGKLKSAEVRPLADGSQVVAVSLAGGEANHFWTSQAFLRMDEKCGLTQLAKFYSRMHYDEDDASQCEGAKHTYRFVDRAIVELRREKIHCEPTREVVTMETTIFDLDELLQNPTLRVVEP